MDIRYDIGSIFQAAFGINSPIYMTQPILLGSPEDVMSGYSGVTVLEDNQEATEESILGTPIMFPIQLGGGKYPTYDMTGKINEVEYKDFVMPPATLVDFSRAKNITRTNVLGSNGTVKEIFGFDDWKIRMRGVCLASADMTAKTQKELLLKWEKVVGSIPVKGRLFLEKDITAITIVDIDFKQLQGQPSVFPFEISAISDQPVELLI